MPEAARTDTPSPSPETAPPEPPAAAESAPAPEAPAPILAPAPEATPAATETAPAGTTTEPSILPFDPAPILGWGLSLGVVILFVYALRRARARRRAEIAGTSDAPRLEEVAPSTPAAAAETTRQALEAEAAAEAVELTEKEARRQAFLASQAEAREAAEARRREEEEQEAARSASRAAEAADREAEAAAREAEAAARREALLAPSGSLTQSLARTRGGLISRLGGVLGKQLDDEAFEELEEILFAADIGVHTATDLLEQVRTAHKKGIADAEGLKGALRERITALLATDAQGELEVSSGPEAPFVIMVVGVNGVGKTTTIGKLAGRLIAGGKTVLLAAGDTFRAAAVEQLEVWGQRVGAEVVKGGEGVDPASVIFDAIEQGRSSGVDVVIADTAGRLHTKVPLMEELQKIHRVMGKARAGAPDEVLLVVDATTGQNALQQTRLFSEVVTLTGIALTKLDGTAKGGVIIGIAAETGLPIRFIGTGEQVGDLRPFEPAAFVEALFDEGDSLQEAKTV